MGAMTDFERRYEQATSNRHQAATALNSSSSRSHAVLSVIVRIILTLSQEIRVLLSSIEDIFLIGLDGNSCVGKTVHGQVASHRLGRQRGQPPVQCCFVLLVITFVLARITRECA